MQSTSSVLRRGQTEPLAALVALSAVCFAISVHAGVITGLVPAVGEPRDVSESTTARVWQHLETGGVYVPNRPLRTAIPTRALPDGYSVEVTVTRSETGQHGHTTRQRRFAPDGTETDVPPPSDARVTTRHIAVRVGAGAVRPGTLRVAVWR